VFVHAMARKALAPDAALSATGFTVGFLEVFAMNEEWLSTEALTSA
jgi:hypothetical protein